ncbi:MAG: hypothetical protein KBS67_02970 [Bacteroidales bacterium]|nr:hypothetical protein [Candidatus Cryptobacteroides equifaecalis]
MTKHAYLILAHKSKEQICKLLELLDHERNDIYLHLDGKSKLKYSDFKSCCKKSGLFMATPRRTVSWGGVSIMRTELQLLRQATAGSYQYYHLLSGQDLPIKSQDAIHSFFDRNQGKEFLTLWENNEQTYNSFHYRTILPENNRFFLAKKLKTMNLIFQKRHHKMVNRDMEESFASQWFSITDAFAKYTVEHEKWLNSVFRRSGQTDELFLATLLANSPFKDNLYDKTLYNEKDGVHSGGSMRYIDWTNSANGRHPATLTAKDFDALMASDSFWARKFDIQQDATIIDMIYNRLKA